MAPATSVSDGLGILADVLFGLWPLLVGLALLGHRGRVSSARLVWVILLVARVYSAIQLNSVGITSPLRIIPEPTNTLVFFAVGAFGVAVLAFRRQYFGKS